jgi:hypothetical protein
LAQDEVNEASAIPGLVMTKFRAREEGGRAINFLSPSRGLINFLGVILGEYSWLFSAKTSLAVISPKQENRLVSHY